MIFLVVGCEADVVWLWFEIDLVLITILSFEAESTTSQARLDFMDRLGMLALDENRDYGTVGEKDQEQVINLLLLIFSQMVVLARAILVTVNSDYPLVMIYHNVSRHFYANCTPIFADYFKLCLGLVRTRFRCKSISPFGFAHAYSTAMRGGFAGGHVSSGISARHCAVTPPQPT
jgi:hypothetical protein